ncbi:hypothetical protein [Tsuneonella amylolytica]|uniref:hypothetical protein n=1 Tax=Tsuneonella amylolytica TaxID=2338327 RepID=UPI000EAA2438|nr:hypothetical protein [Tsuneonella amylolytica]
MTRASSILKRLAMIAGLTGAAIASPGHAATCGITGSATAGAAVYDPFSPTGLPTTNVTLRLQRVNGTGGEKTDIVNFYLKSNSTGADGTQIVPTSVAVEGNVTGLNLDIFYDFNETPPIVAPTSLLPTSGNKFLRIAFTGNNDASNYATVNFQVTLPANLDLNASATLPFDAIFACSTTGGGKGVQQEGSIPNAVVFPITVLSAMQAGYAGSPLDFGEIGNIATSSLSTTPKRTPNSNYIRVQSSGPYEITMTSDNAYKLTPGGAPASSTAAEVKYRVKFLGTERSNALATPITMVCPRAGVGQAQEDRLYVQAQLEEGGAGKVVSPNYRDTLSVTITPRATGTANATDCNAMSGAF